MAPRLLALLLSLTLSLAAENRIAPKPHSTRGPIDFRDVVGVVPHAAGIDVYWQRTNEFEALIRPKLMRTTVSTDGTSRLSRVLIHELDEMEWGARVDGEGTNVQAIWTSFDTIMASPVVNDALKYPEGKVVAPHGNYATINCHASECAVVYSFAGGQSATILDADSNVVGSFMLPEGFHPQNVSFSDQGLFFVRHQLKQVRAALVRRDGSVQYDVAIADADPLKFHAGPLAIAANGAQHVVAFVDYAPEPDEVHAITISDDGTMSEPVRLLHTERHPDLPANVGSLSLAWNGTTYVLGGGYGIGAPFVMRFDSAFRPLDAEPQRGDSPSGASVHAAGERFVIIWPARKPYLTILLPNGEMTPRLELDPTPRRRSVR
jgi:hypothetical protein